MKNLEQIFERVLDESGFNLFKRKKQPQASDFSLFKAFQDLSNDVAVKLSDNPDDEDDRSGLNLLVELLRAFAKLTPDEQKREIYELTWYNEHLI